MNNVTSQQVMVCLKAATFQRVYQRELNVALIKRFIELLEHEEVTHQAISNVLVSMAKMGISDNVAASRQLLQAGLTKLPTANFLDASSMLYAAGELQVLDLATA